MNIFIEKRKLFFPLIGCFVGISLTLFSSIELFFDDAYIHARIAENLSNFWQPAFNIGATPFKVDSSSGYIFLISLLNRFVSSIQVIYFLECLVVIITSILLSYCLALKAKSFLFGLVLIISLLPFFLVAAYGGMETPIVCLLMVMSIIMAFYKRIGGVIFLISLACCFRFEVICLLILILYYYILVEKYKKVLIFFSLPVILMMVIEFYLFGEIIPHAAKAKAIGYNFPLEYTLLDVLSFHQGKKWLIVGRLILLSFIIECIEVIYAKFKLTLSNCFSIFSAAILFAWILGRSLLFPWYYCLFVFAYGLAIFTDNNNVRFANSSRIISKLNSLKKIIGLVVLVLLAFIGLKTFTENSTIRVARYLSLGKYLYQLCPTCKLVTSEIGGLGYSFKGAVYDGFGLADPEAIQFHPLKVPTERSAYSIGALPVKYIELKQPDFIVSMPVFIESLKKSQIVATYHKYKCPFNANYEKVFGDSFIEIYSKQVIPEFFLQQMHCN